MRHFQDMADDVRPPFVMLKQINAGSVEVRRHNKQWLCSVTKHVWWHFVYNSNLNSNTRSHHLTPLTVSVHGSKCVCFIQGGVINCHLTNFVCLLADFDLNSKTPQWNRLRVQPEFLFPVILMPWFNWFLCCRISVITNWQTYLSPIDVPVLYATSEKQGLLDVVQIFKRSMQNFSHKNTS